MAWKRNIRKIPHKVLAQLENMPNTEIVVGCVKVFSAEELRANTLVHLGITLTDQGLEIPERIVPPADSGKYSKRNAEGYEIVRKDLGLQTYYNTVEAPNWGDEWKGTHSVDLPYKAYPREFITPRLSTIEMECPDTGQGRNSYSIKFEIEEVLDRNQNDFEERLLECLNLLQENIGACGVQRAHATFTDYIKTLAVSWEILPPGTAEEAVLRLFRDRKPTERERQAVEERYIFLMGLNPEQLVYGTSGFRCYFGAMLRDDLVVFDNIEYGNAIYIMFSDWEELSRHSRLELLSGEYGKDFERVVHKSGWQEEVKEIIKKKLKG